MKSIPIVTVIALLALSLLGCPSAVGPDVESGALTVVIADEVNARTLAPTVDMSPASFIVAGAHTDGSTFRETITASTSSIGVDRLALGEWVVTVDALNGESVLIGRGAAAVTVVANETAEASITVLPVSGQGALSLTVTWIGSIDGASAAGDLIRLSAIDETPVSFTIEGEATSYTNNELEAGYYTLNLILLDEGLRVASATGEVRIVSGETTPGAVTILNGKGGPGSVAVIITADPSSPLAVALGRKGGTTDLASRGLLGLSVAQTGYPGTPTYAWYVNGGNPPDGSQASGNALYLPHGLNTGDYRVDVVAWRADATPGGSAVFVFRWRGSLDKPPADPQPDWAFYDAEQGVPYLWDGTTWRTFFDELSVTVAPSDADYRTIQEAIDGAPGAYPYTINVGAGIHEEGVSITRPLSLVGAGSGEDGTVLRITGASPLVGEYRPVVTVSTSGASETPVVLRNLRVISDQSMKGLAYQVPGILLRSQTGVSHVTLRGVHVVGTTSPGTAEVGLMVDSSTDVDHLEITDSEFSNMAYGIYFMISASNPTRARHVGIRDTRFENNAIKGVYVEKLSDATFANVTVAGNGVVERTPPGFAWSNAGIDINLKHGTYANLTFSNLTVTGNGLGSYGGAGLVIRARDDAPGYGNVTASLTGVAIDGGSFSNNTVGIRFGEVWSSPPPEDGTWSPTELRALSKQKESTAVTNVTVRNVRYAQNVEDADLVSVIDGLQIGP
jgi:hypothetical protein